MKTLPKGDGSEYNDKMTIMLASGTGPDLLLDYSTFNHIGWTEKGALLDLTPYYDLNKDLLAKLYTQTIKHMTIKGKMVIMPYSAEMSGLFWNKDMFDEGGVSEYPTDAWTWDDLREVAIKLTKRDAEGNATSNRLLMALIRDGKLDFTGTNYTSDGFAMQSVMVDGKDLLIVSGGNSRAVLCAVYDYFERFCDVGCFWDGDQVPGAEGLPFFGIEVREEPTFRYRAVRYFGHKGLKRFHPEMWDLATWQRELDWSVKNKFNMLLIGIGPCDLLQRAFPKECPYPPDGRSDEAVVFGRPGVDPDDRDVGDNYYDPSWVWPLQYQAQLYKDVVRYAPPAKARPLPHKTLRLEAGDCYCLGDRKESTITLAPFSLPTPRPYVAGTRVPSQKQMAPQRSHRFLRE